MADCPHCNLAMDSKTETFIVCSGSCCKSYHAACAGLSELAVRLISKNVIWLCDGCLETFYEQVTRYLTTEQTTSECAITTELNFIKEQIANITEVLSTVAPRTTPKTTPALDTPKSIQCVGSHSTPISPSRLSRGSKIAESTILHSDSRTGVSSNMAEANENKFSLFLTNIDASVSEQEIGCMVAQSLSVVDADIIEVVKLVPRWKLRESLRYVSFKIQLNAGLKRLALQRETWPDGVLFREFTEHPRRTWKPSRCETNMEISQQ